MKKIICILSLSVVLIMLYSVPVHAATGTLYRIEYRSSYGGYYICKGFTFDSPQTTDKWLSYTAQGNTAEGRSISEAISNFVSNNKVFSGYGGAGSMDLLQENYTTIVVSGTVNFTGYSEDKFFGSMQDYEDFLNPPEVTTWYQDMWDTLKEELGNPAFWFGQWFIDLIDNVYGEENDPTGPPKPPNSTHVQINNPTITPAPTPIPYSTIILPKTDPVSGNTYYETNYYYTNPSGTPIITTSPPTNTPSQNGSGNGTDYSPIGGDPYSIPQLSWLTNAALSDGENNSLDGISSISDGMDSIDEIGSNYTEGMGAVQDATGTLPTSWLLLIGIAAAIPLIAGIISRFLS